MNSQKEFLLLYNFKCLSEYKSDYFEQRKLNVNANMFMTISREHLESFFLSAE